MAKHIFTVEVSKHFRTTALMPFFFFDDSGFKNPGFQVLCLGKSLNTSPPSSSVPSLYSQSRRHLIFFLSQRFQIQIIFTCVVLYFHFPNRDFESPGLFSASRYRETTKSFSRRCRINYPVLVNLPLFLLPFLEKSHLNRCLKLRTRVCDRLRSPDTTDVS